MKYPNVIATKLLAFERSCLAEHSAFIGPTIGYITARLEDKIVTVKKKVRRPKKLGVRMLKAPD